MCIDSRSFRPPGARRPPRRRRARLTLGTAAALLCCGAPAVAATYLPGPEADPPTGASVPPDGGSAPTGGSGIRWGLAPLRMAGSLSLDTRWIRLDGGQQSTQGVLFNDVEAGTFVWQPWFMQVRGGLGALLAQDRASAGDGTDARSTSQALTGRFTLAVFPVSRFPFELRADVSDSRVRGDHVGSDYRSHRIGVSQAYRPLTGNDSYQLNYERSRLSVADGSADTLETLRFSAMQRYTAQSVELNGHWSDNRRSDTDEHTKLSQLAARHTYHPAGALHVDTLATWNETSLAGGSSAARMDSVTDLRQISTFATWRPREGDWLYDADAPLHLTGTVRAIDTTTESASTEQRLRAINASLGVNKALTREWRASGAMSGTQIEQGDATPIRSAAANGNISYTPTGLRIGEWRYSPTLGTSVGATRSSDAGMRHTVAMQAAHGVSRGLRIGEADTLSLSLTQSVGALHDSQTRVWSRALSHSASLFWQGSASGASQTYAGLSASDSRTWADQSGSFQLVNLQFSHRAQLSRHSSWSGNLTIQATRADTEQVDAFSGQQRQASAGWQRHASGTLNHEHQRLFGVPRLRLNTLLSVNTQQFESRALGDIDAARERISESLESRLDYSIGKLETRVSARLARVEGRSTASLFARVQRRY